MKTTQRLALSILVLGGVALTAGCPGLIPNVTPSVSPTETSQASMIKGTVKYNSAAAPNIVLNVKKYDGSAWVKDTNISATSASDGTYSFSSLADGRYQVMYDDGGLIAASDTNTVGTLVLEPVTVSATQSTAPVTDMDLYWLPNNVPAASASFSANDSFSWNAYSNAPATADYQVVVSDSNKSAKWSSAWGTTRNISWNGKAGTETNSPTGTTLANGNYYYQIKFRKQGGTFGGGNFYGQTKFVPFTIQ